MNEEFRAFSFVDRIHSDETGKHIVGEYHIPADVGHFPQSLVAEAIGQLAAWSSMKAIDFACRPVAGIAGAVDLNEDTRPGQTLQLEAVLEKSDDSAVEYGGVATMEGREVVRLHHCLGPMVPIEEYHDPANMRARYEQLLHEGAERDAYRGVPKFGFETTGGDPGRSLEGRFVIPESAPFFGDHFPRRPVFPGTLLMNLNLQFATTLAGEHSEGDNDWKGRQMKDVKIRSFMEPGTELDLIARIDEAGDDEMQIVVETKRGKRLTSAARVLLSRGE